MPGTAAMVTGRGCMKEQGTEPPSNTSPRVSELIKFNKIINNIIKAFFFRKKKRSKSQKLPSCRLL